MRIFITIFSVGMVWWMLSLLYPPAIIPSPVETMRSLVKITGEKTFWSSLGISSYRLSIGFGMACVFGGALGCVIGRYHHVYEYVRPFVMIIQSVPPVSWMLLAILWFGVNGGAQITVVFLSLFPIFFFHAAQAIREVPKELIEVAKVYEVGLLKTVCTIYLPAMKPFWLSALVITIGIGWKTIVMAEVISGHTGIGAAMNTARIYIKTEEVFAWTLVVACLGIVAEFLVRALNKEVH